MLALTRFRVSPDAAASFVDLGRAAEAFYRGRPGNEGCDLLQNVDDPTLWVLASRWRDVGSYRRAFNGYEAKVVLTPLMLLAVDEPGAYAPADAVGSNLPRGETPIA